MNKHNLQQRQPALFLDRDGVINVDKGYIYKPEQVEFIDGIFDICRYSQQHGYRIFIITNQSGIARGYYTEQDFHQLTDWMCDAFHQENIIIDHVYFCPYHAEHGIGHYKQDSPNRKPNPGMLFNAAAQYHIDLARSILIGNSPCDIQAGLSAGIQLNILLTSTHHLFQRDHRVKCVSDLRAAHKILVTHM